MSRDPLTALHFNQRVTFTSPKPYTIGGYELDRTLAATLTGALDGSHIKLALEYPDNDHTKLASGAKISVVHPFLARTAEYVIAQTDTGYAWLTTHYVVLLPQYTNQGLGIRMFAHQAATADEVGISQIWLHALGTGSGSIYNGSYTWARYGFDGMLDARQEADFAKRFPGIANLDELMSTAQGRAAWKARPFSLRMCFDLTDQRCWDRLQAYMVHKGVAL
jgi:hypothetical protein